MKPTEPEFLFIYLTRGKFALVDFDAPIEVFSRKWRAQAGKQTQTCYAICTMRLGVNRRKEIKMHRVIAGVTDPKMQVDHRNGNGLDNRRGNLRNCTNQQNNRNKPSFRGVSKYKGVTFESGPRPWRARIRVFQKTTSIGYFITEEEAAIAYNEVAKRICGEFACLNVIEAEGMAMPLVYAEKA